MEPGRPRNYVLHALDLFAGFGRREALVGSGRRLTYAQLRAEVLDRAAALHRAGVRPGAAVAVLTGLTPDSVVLHLALHLLGCRSVWLRSGAPTRELSEFVRRGRPEVLIYDPRTYAEPADRVLGELPGAEVLCLGPDGRGPDLSVFDPTEVDGLGFDPESVPVEPEALFFTSGTTGTPKLILHRHGFYRQIHALAEELVAAGDPVWRHLSLSVLGHVSGQTSALLYLFAGGVLFLMPDYEPDGFLRLVERERINSTFISPPDLYELLDHPTMGRVDLSSMTTLSVGAAPATPARLLQAVDRLGPVVRITYGLSETPFVSALPGLTDDPERAHLLRSCGRPYGDVRVEVRDETGAVLGPGRVGELWVASRLNFAGYFEQPELTEDALADGWVRTRDLGYLDADGLIYLVGRSQEVIITGQICEMVYPRPIEDVLATHPQVRAAAVIGVPDPAIVEAVHAFVVVADGATVTEAELIDLVGQELTEDWAPRSVQFVPGLPLVGLGKVDKKLLRARYLAEHQEPVAPAPN